jgi:hypothetical protein
MNTSDNCECLRFGPNDSDDEDIGVDTTNGRYGDVSVSTCRHCGRRWLFYFAEYESFTGSGRWIRGIVPDELPMPLTPENAVPIFNTLPWYIYSGSAFYLRPPKRRARGNAPADLMASPGEPVPSPYDNQTA